MNNCNQKWKAAGLALAVEAALTAMYGLPAYAQDEDIVALKEPTNFVQIGVSNTSKSSAKFGEYTGLAKDGADLVGNFGIRGGDAYGDRNGTRRWAITGTDLGLTSRVLGASYADQGQWNLGIGYDELRHNTTVGYQTPYAGAMGSNGFTLPGFGVVNATGVAPGTRALTPIQRAAFHTVDVNNTRKNTSLTLGYNFSPAWDVRLDYNRLKQSGAKLMAFGSAGPAVTAEAVSILPNPTNFETDTLNLALNWTGDKAYMTGSYFASLFRDNYDRVTFQTYAGATSAIQTMTTPPSNNFHQLNLNGGYAIASSTKLAGGLSYARNTQNDAFIVDPGVMLTPLAQTSLNGKIVTTHADLKLTDQTIPNLGLAAGIKYDKQDDQTTSNIYHFNSLQGAAATVAKYPNTPLSFKKTQVEVAGDYRLAKFHQLRVAYNRDDIKRWCNNYAASAAGVLPGVLGYYPAGTNCVTATGSKEDRLGATYRLKVSSVLSFNAGYTYGNRKADFDQNAIAAFISMKGNPNVGLLTATTIKGINGGDFIGFHPYFEASRKQQQFKAGVDWQATEAMSVGLRGRYTDDKYDTTYGVTKGRQGSMNLDVTYNYSDNGSISAFATRQYRQRDLTDLQKAATEAATAATAVALGIPPGANWTNTLREDDTTLGIGFKHDGLMGDKLSINGDVTYSLGRSGYGTRQNYPSTTLGGGATCASAAFLTCGDLPTIRNEMTEFKLTGTYRIDKTSTMGLGYLFRRLKSDDYFYNGYQYGFTPNSLMPSNQQSGSYAVNVVMATYTYSFR